MTDVELIARLRDEQPVTQDFQHTLKCAMMDAAADRIEALVKEKGYALHRIMELEDRTEALIAENKRLGQQCEGLMRAGMNNGQALIIAENKLAKAVEALEHYAAWSYDDAVARATLAEIKGESHE